MKIDDKVNDLKLKKKRYLELLADKLISHEDYREATDHSHEMIKEMLIKRSELAASLLDEKFYSEQVQSTERKF